MMDLKRKFKSYYNQYYLCADPGLASSVDTGLVNWFSFCHDFKDSWQIIYEAK